VAVVRITRLLDQLGWQEDGDRDSYQLDVDEDIVRFMEGLERRARNALEDDRVTLRADRKQYARYNLTDAEW
jgi:hypothetical protein